MFDSSMCLKSRVCGLPSCVLEGKEKKNISLNFFGVEAGSLELVVNI